LKTIKNKSKIKVHPASIRLLTDATWDFAQAVLWSGFDFSSAEIELSKSFIKEYYQEIPAKEFTRVAYKHFTEYCKRILLAKEYDSRFFLFYIPHPCIWLNKQNPKGISAAKAGYHRNLKKRKQTCIPSGMDRFLNHFYSQRKFFPMNTEPQKEKPKQTVLVKPYTVTELAKIYGVCRETLQSWINEFKDEVGEKKGRYYTIPQVKIIFKNLCVPHTIELD